MRDPDVPPALVADDVIVVLTDLQPAIVYHSRTNPEARLRRAVGVLVDGAGVLGIPVLRSVIRLGPDIAPELIDELRAEPPVIRSTVGVMDHEQSRHTVLAHQRSVLAVGGVSTEIAVLHAVLGARRQGHRVHVLVDVCGSLNERAEQAAFRQMEGAGATLSSVPSLLTGLTPDLESPRGRAVLGLLARLRAE